MGKKSGSQIRGSLTHEAEWSIYKRIVAITTLSTDVEIA